MANARRYSNETLDARQDKQVVAGPVQITNTLSLANTSFATPTNRVMVQVTPTRSGKFRIHGNIGLQCINNASRIEAKVVQTAGPAATVIATHACSMFGNASATVENTLALGLLVSLVAGQTYTFDVQTRNLSGAGTYNVVPGNIDTALGNCLVAEEL